MALIGTHRCRRMGRFYLPVEFVDERHPMVTRIMGACSILRAECLPWRDDYEYAALSRLFRELEQGVIVPFYVWRFNDDDGSFEAVEAPSGTDPTRWIVDAPGWQGAR